MPTIFRARATISVGGLTSLLTAYFQDNTSSTNSAVATEAVARVRAFANGLNGAISSSGVFTPNLTVDLLDSATGALTGQATASAPAAVTWAGTSDMLPPQTQGNLRLNTAGFVNGRRVIGRIFIPYPREDGSDSAGRLASGTVTTYNTAGALLRTTVVTAITQVVWHRPVNGAGGNVFDVTSCAAQPAWAVLKSRRD